MKQGAYNPSGMGMYIKSIVRDELNKLNGAIESDGFAAFANSKESRGSSGSGSNR